MLSDARTRLIADLADKAYREAFVEAHIRTGVPVQIKALRTLPTRQWTQRELGARAGGMAAERVSLLERPDAPLCTIGTLLRLASAFDVGLLVRFVPFQTLIDMELALSPETIAPVDFATAWPVIDDHTRDLA